MKFAWKVTLSALCVLVLTTGLGSWLLISLSFQSSLDREIAVAREELEMLRISYEAVCDARGVTLENMSDRGGGLRRVLAGDPYFSGQTFRIAGTGGDLYSTLSSPGDDALLDQVDAASSGYAIRRDGDQVLIHCAGPAALPDGVVYIETERDISQIFADRAFHFRVYRWILLAAAGLGCCAMYLLSRWLTRPIRDLGAAAQALAGGDYASRAAVSGGDEIADLDTSFNHMADAIEKNVQDLADAARRQEDFTASFVHELKTPLTSIIGYADMLRSRHLTEEQRLKAAGYIFSEGRRLEHLSLSLLDLLVTGRGCAEAKSVDMEDLCVRAADVCRPAMEARGVKLFVRAEAGAVQGDGALLQTLAQNLLDNARKASSPGGAVALEGHALPDGRYELSVSDRGRGIPAEELDKITEPFYMVDKSRARAQGGAGLGLALCQKIAQLHGGALRFESKEGVGTQVTVDLGGVAHD